MHDWYIGLIFVLVLSMMVGMLRILRGPTPADRMLATQLFGTTGVAIILLLAHGLDFAALYDVALIFALLAAVAILTFIRRAWHPTSLTSNHSQSE